jgi:alpha-tubulin suppressor-like RCC1 family protein
MNTPPDGETKTAAAARLVLYMSMYVYAGPTTPPPPYTPSADAVVGVVTPNAPATIVTPTLHAGVQLEAGSVAENTVIVVTQNPTPYPDNCSGPLQTKLCQYPQFYTFDMFPHNRLLKAAKFSVCHVNSGERRRPLADHDRFRLAHAKPANPADYTPGSTVRDQNGESIEILPLVAQTFSTCVNNAYATNAVSGGPLGLFSRLARSFQNIIRPEAAYAIDVGLGGLAVYMSPFNVLDSLGRPDWKVETVSFAPGPVHPGDHVLVTYTIANIGTATGTAVQAAVRLSTDAVLTTSDMSLAPISLPLLPPDSAVTLAQTVVIPDTVAAGTYYLGVAIQDDPLLPDANLANNQAAVITTVEPSFVSPPNTMSVGSATACALTSSGSGFCWGANDRHSLGTISTSPASSSSPFASGIPDFATLSGGSGQHFCGIASSGSAMCWGRADQGALGAGISLISSAPVAVAGEINWTAINMSRLTGCGVSATNVGYCWGANQRGEVGSAAIPIRAVTLSPHILDGGHAWKNVVAGWLHACGITTTGAAYCWGDNEAGQLGIGTADTDFSHIVPVPVATTERFIQLSLGTRSTCGITTNHEAFCWGENGTGQIGDGTTTFKTIPTPVAGGYRFSYIAVATGFGDGSSVPFPPNVGVQGNIGHTCALTEAGAPYCWGWNGNGQLGDGTTIDHLTPAPVTGNLSLTSIRLGGSATCGRRRNQIWCWGSNLVGQLGNGTQVNSLTPSLVSSPFNAP